MYSRKVQHLCVVSKHNGSAGPPALAQKAAPRVCLLSTSLWSEHELRWSCRPALCEVDGWFIFGP